MTDCREGDRYGKGLFIEFGESRDDALVDVDQGPQYDVEVDGEELVQGDEGLLFVVRRNTQVPTVWHGSRNGTR